MVKSGKTEMFDWTDLINNETY